MISFLLQQSLFGQLAKTAPSDLTARERRGVSLHRSALTHSTENHHRGQWLFPGVTRNFTSLTGSTFPRYLSSLYFSFFCVCTTTAAAPTSATVRPRFCLFMLCPLCLQFPYCLRRCLPLRRGSRASGTAAPSPTSVSWKLSEVIFLWLGVPHSGSKHSGRGMVYLAALWYTSSSSSSSNKDIFQCRAQRSFVLGVIDRGKPCVLCNDLKGDV